MSCKARQGQEKNSEAIGVIVVIDTACHAHLA